MIVRILGEGQYELDGETVAALERADAELLEAVAEGDEAAYRERFAAVLALVRRQGRPVPWDRLAESDLILPAEGTSLAEARALFPEESHGGA